MKPASDDKPDDAEPVIHHAWAVVLSVLVVMGGLFFGLPLLLAALPPVAAWVPVVLLIIPALPTISGWWMGRMDARLPGERGVRALPREYLFQAWSLAMELTMLLASLPLIAAQLLGVIAAVMLMAFGAVLVLACAQGLFGLHIEGVSRFGAADLWVAGKILLGSVGATIASAGLGAVLECVFDRGTDIAAIMNRRVIHWLQKHV